MSSAVNRTYLFYIVIVSALGGLLFGFDSGVISGCEKAIQTEYGLDGFWHGFTVAVALIGTIIGAFGIGRPTDVFGRKPILIAMAVFYFISAVGCAFAPNWATLVFMRWLGGVAIGGSSVVVPLYIVESAPGPMRGRLVALNQLNIVLGILVSYVSNYYVAQIAPEGAIGGACEKLAACFTSTALPFESIIWRLQLGVEAFPAALFFFLLFTIPESPRQLVRFGRPEEAKKVLARIGDVSPETTLGEISASLAKAEGGQNVPLFQKAYFTPIFLAWAVAMFNQVSGINAINYYAPRIFEMFIGKQNALGVTIGLGTVNLLATIAALFLIDRFGRRFLLMLGAVGTTVMHLLAAWQLGLGADANKFVAIPAILGFIGFFGVSQGAVIWVFISEIFPNAVRAKGQALGSFTHWFMCALISWTFPIIAGLSETSGQYAFYFFASMTALQFFFAWKLMPETKGGTIENVEERWKPTADKAA